MVNIYKLQLTILQQEILRFFFINAGLQFNVNQIAKALDVSQAGIAKAIKALVKREYIHIKKDSGRWSIQLNRNNLNVVSLKRVDNLRIIYESGLAKHLFESFPGATIILFGSYSRGEDVIEHSDIDIALVGVKEEDLNLKKYCNHLKRDVVLQFFNSFEKIDENLRNNLLNGIVLSGSVEL